MAEEVQIQGTSSMAKIRAPWAVAVLTLVTLGIYGLVWYYKINREMADLGKATGRTEELGDNPTMSLLALFPGSVVVVPAIISYIHTHRRIVATQRLTGGGDPLNGWLVLIMFLVFSPIAYAYWQSGLSKAWQAQAGGAAEPAAAPAPAV
jgi:hypothetical protein